MFGVCISEPCIAPQDLPASTLTRQNSDLNLLMILWSRLPGLYCFRSGWNKLLTNRNHITSYNYHLEAPADTFFLWEYSSQRSLFRRMISQRPVHLRDLLLYENSVFFGYTANILFRCQFSSVLGHCDLRVKDGAETGQLLTAEGPQSCTAGTALILLASERAAVTRSPWSKGHSPSYSFPILRITYSKVIHFLK